MLWFSKKSNTWKPARSSEDDLADMIRGLTAAMRAIRTDMAEAKRIRHELELLRDGQERLVSYTSLPDGRWVSTVKLTPGASEPGGRQFETIVSGDEFACSEYLTREAAIAGHLEVVDREIGRRA